MFEYIPKDNKFCFAVLVIIALTAAAYVGIRILYAEAREREANKRELIRRAREYKRAEELAYCEQFSEVAKECELHEAEWIARQWVERFRDD